MELTLITLGLIQTLFCGLNLIIASLKFRKSRNRIFLILIGAFILVFINAISIIAIGLINNPALGTSVLAYSAYQMIGITGTGTFFLTYVFLELLYYERLQIATLLYVTTLFTGYIFLAFLPISYEFYFDSALGLYNFHYMGIIQFIIFILIISVSIYFLFILIQIKKLAKDKIQVAALKLFIGGLCITVFGLIFSSQLNHREWMAIFNSLGLFFLGLSFYQHPNLVFLNPNDLYYLIITNDNGITLYSRKFHTAFSDVDENLLGGALNAVSSLFMEILQASDHFNHIKMENRVLLFQTIKKLSVVLIVRKSSFLLHHTLYSFSHAVYERFQQKLQNWGGNLQAFEGIEDVLKQYFPFIDVK